MLNHKIDFCMVIAAEMCNPNGDPLNGNLPRQDFNGHGIMTDVCLKRKIRNRLQDMGYEIFMQAQDRIDDGARSLKERADSYKEFATATKKANPDISQCTLIASKKWIDVRAFGQVFALKKSDSVSFGIRGPVSITFAKSLDTVDIQDIMMAKSMNAETTDKDKKDSATLPHKYVITKGAYVARGSIFPDLSKKTGFSDNDAEIIKKAILEMFEPDASSARPSGSMVLSKLYWWEHPNISGLYSSFNVFNSLEFAPCDDYPYFTVKETPLDNLTPQIYTNSKLIL